jgi:hypothetical protein
MPAQLCTIPTCPNYQKYCRFHLVETFKTAVPIKKEADSRKEANKEYKKIAKEFITKHPKCQVKGCSRPSACIHHRKGRIGELLTDKKHFLAVCLPCHQKIENHPEWANQMGYSVSRLKSEV